MTPRSSWAQELSVEGGNAVTRVRGRTCSWTQELSVEAALAGVKKNGQEGKVAQEEVQAGGDVGEGRGGKLTEYEQQRLANIRRNAELLKDLGIAQHVADIRRVTSPSLRLSREVCAVHACICI